jgi:hypothetical protein
MAGMVAEDLHLKLTPQRPPAPGDSARAAEILTARLPLSVARWHQHISWCLPGGSLSEARRRWSETRNGQPVFGPRSPIATQEACDAVGGRFRPRLFGWMVHVMAFSAGDPWSGHDDSHSPHHH